MTEKDWLPQLEAACAQYRWNLTLARCQIADESGTPTEIGTGDPLRVSDAGAVGLLQVEPGTALELLQANPALLVSILKIPSVSIALGMFYEAIKCLPAAGKVGLRNAEALKGALCGYDGGDGILLDAARKFGWPTKVPTAITDLDPFLPAETSQYWQRIWALFEKASG
jgi:hypothetical protein